jgi:hypothetical protein
MTDYLYYVKPGGSETCNCLLSGPEQVDIHLGIGADAGIARKLAADTAPTHERVTTRNSVIVEITPHWQAAHQPNWSLGALRHAVGRQVYVVGQLLLDNEHDDPKDNCALPRSRAKLLAGERLGDSPGN